MKKSQVWLLSPRDYFNFNGPGNPVYVCERVTYSADSALATVRYLGYDGSHEVVKGSNNTIYWFRTNPRKQWKKLAKV